MLGGGLKGSQILGQYPDDLSHTSPLNTGRGRIIPTMPWDSPFNAIAEWLGIQEETELDTVLPNRKAFPNNILRENDVFSEEKGGASKHCDCKEVTVSCDPPLIDETVSN